MTHAQSSCLLLFVKYPEKGKVKLRLSADLDEDTVVDLYRCFVSDTLDTIKKTHIQCYLCFYPTDMLEKFQKWLGTAMAFFPQEGTNLGQRMKNCFMQAFAKGYQHVILIGSDSPDLPADILLKALDELQTNDVVLGPSCDGGYYLIGFQNKSFEPSVFDDVHWGTASVFTETIQKIEKKNYHLSILPVWSDVDTLTDLKSLIKRNQNTSFISSTTMTYLKQKKMIPVEDEDGSR
jgi:rSAM/selenodomain-associated transferase 1